MMRKFLIGFGALVVVLVAAALIGPNFIDWNRYKPEITAQAKAATGRDLVIDGDLGLTILPALRLTVRDARFANVKGGSAPDMARLKAFDIQVRLLPLLQGRFEVDAITLIEPEIVLERLADGRVNWDFTTPPASGAPASPAGADGVARGGSARAVRLDNLRIRRGTVIYRDAVARTEERISGLTVRLEARSLNGPFHAKGEVTARQIPFSFEAAIGELKPTAAAPVNLLVTIPLADARAELSGGAVIVGASPRFTGKLTINGKDLRRLIAAMSGQSRTVLPAALAQPYLIKSALKGSQTGGSIDNLEFELGGARASGGVTITAGDRLRAEARLKMTRIDLDSWLSEKAEPGAPRPAAPSTGGSATTKPATAARVPFALPDFDATLDAEVAAITYNRQNIRNVALKASLVSGVARVDRLALFLPGGGEAALNGTLSAESGKPKFQGKIDAQADNLRAVISWLGVDVAAVPSDRLRKFAFSAALSGDDEQVHLLGAKISVDTTRIDGGVTLALRDRPAFGATVNIDTLDIDAYAPRQDTTRSTAAKPEAADGDATTPKAAMPATRGPFAALNDFDANVRFKVDHLTAHKIALADVRFEGTLVGGVMTIRNASVGDIGGARAAVSGTAGNFAAIPVFKGTISADAKDFGGILRLAGVTPPQGAQSLGALRLRGTADARADLVDMDLALDAAGASVKFKGITTGLDGAPRLDATLTASHGDLSQLLQKLGVEPPADKLGAFDLSARLKGGLDKVATSVTLKAIGGTLTSTGTVAHVATAPAFDLVITASHPSVGDMGRAFAPDYRPVGGKIGPLTINATVKGAQSDYALTALTATAGKVTLLGSGKLSTKGARPALTAAMTAGDIDLNPFLPLRPATAQASAQKSGAGAGLPPASTAARQPATAGGEHFSAQPFDMSALGLIDADLSIAAKSMIYRQFRVDNPTIKGTLADSLLTVQEIAGKMFDGSFRMTGKLDARKTPALDGAVTVEKANVGKALLQASEFDISGGITDFTMQLAGAGISPRVMAGALNGSGRIASRDGIVKGFDLQAVSNKLKNLDNAIDFLTLFGASMGGGQTRFTSLDGTFEIKNGIVASNDIRLVADAGEARVGGFADLPRWNMDFNGAFSLTEHPKAPPFGMRAVGPIDNPRRLFQFEKLQAYLLQRGIGTMLRKVFPGKEQQQMPANQTTPNQQQQQQPKKPRLEDIIPGLLKGLGR